MEIRAVLNRYRKSAQKVREVTRKIKGMPVSGALAQLHNSRKGCSQELIKLINSAVANAKNNFNLSEEGLFIKDFRADEKMTMKRWRARAYGRAARIMKRTCSVTLVLDEKKSAKKKRQAEIKDRVKAIKDEENKTAEKGKPQEKTAEKPEEKASAKRKSANLKDIKDIKERKSVKEAPKGKIFRRKSF